MSEQNPEAESDQPPVDSEVIASSSNGVHRDGAAEADQAGAPTEATVEDDGSSFVDDLVRAMQKTAGAERTRLGKEADRRREAHLATIQARREAEARTMRKLADDDLKSIDSWADEERQRVQAEHERRAAALRADLETSLAEHSSRIDREVAEVEAAITAYRSDTDTYFASLDRESDPVEIARQARNRPAFPTLDVIGRQVGEAEPATAESSDAATTVADAEPADPIAAEADPDGSAKETDPQDDSAPASPAVAVMDPDASARLAESWSTWSGLPADPSADPSADAPADATAEASDEPATATVDATAATPEASAAVAVADDTFDLVTARTRVSSSGPTPLLQSVPISRPMSWLRRGGASADRDADGDRQDR